MSYQEIRKTEDGRTYRVSVTLKPEVEAQRFHQLIQKLCSLPEPEPTDKDRRASATQAEFFLSSLETLHRCYPGQVDRIVESIAAMHGDWRRRDMLYQKLAESMIEQGWRDSIFLSPVPEKGMLQLNALLDTVASHHFPDIVYDFDIPSVPEE